jgi:hypothetical protein
MMAIITYGGNEYRFNGWHFEMHRYCGPHPLKKNGEPMAKIPQSFWGTWKQFDALSADEKERHMVWKSPGCVHIAERS